MPIYDLIVLKITFLGISKSVFMPSSNVCGNMGTKESTFVHTALRVVIANQMMPKKPSKKDRDVIKDSGPFYSYIIRS